MKKTLSSLLALCFLSLVSGCGLVAGQVLAQFELELEPQQLSVPADGAGQVTVRIKPLTGVALSSVSVSLTKKPVGISADPNALIVFSESTWTILVDEAVAPGVYDLDVEAVSQGFNLIPVTKAAKLRLTVTAAQ